MPPREGEMLSVVARTQATDDERMKNISKNEEKDWRNNNKRPQLSRFKPNANGRKVEQKRK